MLASLKIIGAVVGVTGAVGGITYAAVGQTGNSNDSLSPKSFGSASQTLSSWAKNESCTFIDSSRKEIFYILGTQVKDHVATYCQNIDAKGATVVNGDKWIGFFPKAVFNNTTDLAVKTSFNLKMSATIERKEARVETKVTFESDKFLNSSFSGQWGDDIEFGSDRTIKTINITSSGHENDKVFIRFGQESEIT